MRDFSCVGQVAGEHCLKRYSQFKYCLGISGLMRLENPYCHILDGVLNSVPGRPSQICGQVPQADGPLVQLPERIKHIVYRLLRLTNSTKQFIRNVAMCR